MGNCHFSTSRIELFHPLSDKIAVMLLDASGITAEKKHSWVTAIGRSVAHFAA
jgi:hypothetical protein